MFMQEIRTTTYLIMVDLTAEFQMNHASYVLASHLLWVSHFVVDILPRTEWCTYRATYNKVWVLLIKLLSCTFTLFLFL